VWCENEFYWKFNRLSALKKCWNRLTFDGANAWLCFSTFYGTRCILFCCELLVQSRYRWHCASSYSWTVVLWHEKWFDWDYYTPITELYGLVILYRSRVLTTYSCENYTFSKMTLFLCDIIHAVCLRYQLTFPWKFDGESTMQSEIDSSRLCFPSRLSDST